MKLFQPITKELKTFLDAQQAKYARKDLDLHQKTPWVRLTSNAVSVYDSKSGRQASRKDWVLNGSVVRSVDPADGRTPLQPGDDGLFTQKLTGWREDRFGTMYAGDRRNLPRPGVSQVDISGATGGNEYGTIRRGRVTMNIPWEGDFELMSKFYMTVGVNVLVEWGWSDYEGSYLNLDKYSSSTEVLKAIFEKEKSGKYGAIFGPIFNFDYAANPQGGFDASIELMSPNFFTPERNISTALLPQIPIIKQGLLIPAVDYDNLDYTDPVTNVEYFQLANGTLIEKPQVDNLGTTVEADANLQEQLEESRNLLYDLNK